MKINDSIALGEAIRERRKELNYTQAYLAEFTGLSVTFISDVERGKKTAEIEKILQFPDALRAAAQELKEKGLKGIDDIYDMILKKRLQ